MTNETADANRTPAAPRPVPSYRAIRRRQHILRLTIAVPAVVIGLGAYWFAQRQLTREVESRMQWLAQHKAEEVSTWVNELKIDLAAVGRLSPLRRWLADWAGDPRRTTDSINRYLEVARDVYERRFGALAVRTTVGSLWSGPPQLAAVDTTAFRTAVGGSTAAVFRSRPLPDQASDILVYTPVRDDGGNVTAILIGAASDALLTQELVDPYGPPSQRTYLVDSTERVIACWADEVEGGGRYAPSGMVAAARAGRPVVHRYRVADGEEMLGALSWIESLGWGVLAERSAQEAFGPLDRWRLLIVAAVLTVIGFGFALSTIMGNRTMRQLETRERELRTTHEQLITADRLASVGMMAASIAHEVNNPLTTIKVLIHSVQDRIGNSDEVSEDLTVAQGEIDKIKVLVLRFLQFARPREPEFATVHVNDILHRVLALVRPQGQTRNIALQEIYDEHLPPVWADGAQLGQAFLNILFNALEATPPEGRIRVRSAETEDGSVSVRIWNSGPGLSPDLTEKIFEPFFSTKATGTGLGLPIARIILDKHHGAITAEGHGERGTSFFITLPRVALGGNDAPRVGG